MTRGELTDRPGSRRQSCVKCEQRRVERLGERNVEGVAGPDVGPQFPCPSQQWSVPDSLAGPVVQIVDGKSRRGRIEQSGLLVAAGDAQHLGVDDVWGNVVLVS